MVTLCLVLGGTAVAATVSGDTKADTKLIKKLAPSLSVKHAATASAVQGLVKFHVLIAPGGPDVVVDKSGALTIVAHCDTTGPTADLYVRTTQAHSTMDAWDQNNDFGPADTTINWGAPSGTFEANVKDGVAVAPDGSFITMVSNGIGYNIGSSPGKCIFVGANINR
jgi:hypothetical protein